MMRILRWSTSATTKEKSLEQSKKFRTNKKLLTITKKATTIKKRFTAIQKNDNNNKKIHSN